MLFFLYMLISLSVCVYIVRRFIAHHPEQQNTVPEINPLLAENEECVTEEESWKEQERDEDDKYIEDDEPNDDEYIEEVNEEPYEEAYIEPHPYGYDQLFADDPESSDWGSSYDSQTECDDFHREHTEDDRW